MCGRPGRDPVRDWSVCHPVDGEEINGELNDCGYGTDGQTRTVTDQTGTPDKNVVLQDLTAFG